MSGEVRAPWSPEEVAALNAWQGRADRHPFTCPADGTHGSEKHSDRRILFATTERWECHHCAYVQHWAHDFMAVVISDEALCSCGHPWSDHKSPSEGDDGCQYWEQIGHHVQFCDCELLP